MKFEIGFYKKLFFPFPTVLIQRDKNERKCMLVWFNFYIGFADRMTKKINIGLVILLMALTLFLGVFTGRHQSKKWSVVDKHIKLEQKGYSYCPYCGEKFER